jgi:hypothetical protein
MKDDSLQGQENNGLSFVAAISSKGDQPNGMVVSSARIIIDGKEQVLIDEELNLKINGIKGDKLKSSAIFSSPIHRLHEPIIKTTNNASISNANIAYRIELPKKRINVKSEKGLFATIRINHQEDKNFDYLDILIGAQGDTEHGHMAFHFDGNGKCILSRKYNCSLSVEQSYSTERKEIIPSKIMITLDDFQATLRLRFESSFTTKIAKLIDAKFDT